MTRPRNRYSSTASRKFLGGVDGSASQNKNEAFLKANNAAREQAKARIKTNPKDMQGLLVLTITVGGGMLGPLLPGVFNDYLFKNGNLIGYSLALTAENMIDWAEMNGIESVVIDSATTPRAFLNELRWNAIAWRR